MVEPPPNISLSRRMPSSHEGARHGISNIANHLREYRNNALFQAVLNFLRRLRHRRHQDADEETGETVFEALQRRVASIQRSQDPSESLTEGPMTVGIEIPVSLPSGDRARAFLEVRVPVNERITAIDNEDVIQMRVLEDQNNPGNDVGDGNNSSSFSHLGLHGHEFYEPFYPFGMLMHASRRRSGDESVPLIRFPEMVTGVREEDDIDEEDMQTGEVTAATPEGALAEEIGRLPLFTATDEHVDQTCPVCLEQFESNAPMRMLPCGHVFHPSCIANWIIRNPSCPIDRRSIFQDSNIPNHSCPNHRRSIFHFA